MTEVHLHPDQFVIVRVNGVSVYVETFENFALDFGAPVENPSAPWIERLYIPNVMNRLGDGKTQETTVEVWVQGDEIINNLNQLIEAKELRTAPIVPEEE